MKLGPNRRDEKRIRWHRQLPDVKSSDQSQKRRPVLTACFREVDVTKLLQRFV